MVNFEAWIAVSISFVGVVLVPLVILLWRVSAAIARNQDKLFSLEDSVKNLVADKDKVHSKMYEQMREDRLATNARLRWLEENVWNMRKRA